MDDDCREGISSSSPPRSSNATTGHGRARPPRDHRPSHSLYIHRHLSDLGLHRCEHKVHNLAIPRRPAHRRSGFDYPLSTTPPPLDTYREGESTLTCIPSRPRCYRSAFHAWISLPILQTRSSGPPRWPVEHRHPLSIISHGLDV